MSTFLQAPKVCVTAFVSVWILASTAMGQTQFTNVTVTNELKLQASPAPAAMSLRSDGSLISLSPFTAWYPAVPLNTITSNSSLLLWDSGKMAFRAGLFNPSSLAGVGAYSAAFGQYASAGHYSFAGGYNSSANYLSFAFGQYALASGPLGVAMGDSATALGPVSFATGAATTASGYASSAFGAFNLASGSLSVAMGWNTRAESFGSLVIGRYNLGGFTAGGGGTGGDQNWIPADPIFEIGNGTGPGPANRSNALTVYKNGNAVFQGVVRVAPGGDIPMFGQP